MAKKDQMFVTAKSKAVYPHFNEADTKFDKDGKYHAKLHMPADDPATLAIVKACKDMCPAGGHMPISRDPDTGDTVIKVTSKFPPVLVDGATGKRREADAEAIGNGSIVRCALIPSTYNAGGNEGVTCYLKGVQLFELVSFGGADMFGDAEVEDESVEALMADNPPF